MRREAPEAAKKCAHEGRKKRTFTTHPAGADLHGTKTDRKKPNTQPHNADKRTPAKTSTQRHPSARPADHHTKSNVKTQACAR